MNKSLLFQQRAQEINAVKSSISRHASILILLLTFLGLSTSLFGQDLTIEDYKKRGGIHRNAGWS
jgi:hypothetical protein